MEAKKELNQIVQPVIKEEEPQKMIIYPAIEKIQTPYFYNVDNTYNKASYITINGVDLLLSYNTEILIRINDIVFYDEYYFNYSVTTSKHISKYFNYETGYYYSGMTLIKLDHKKFLELSSAFITNNKEFAKLANKYYNEYLEQLRAYDMLQELKEAVKRDKYNTLISLLYERLDPAFNNVEIKDFKKQDLKTVQQHQYIICCDNIFKLIVNLSVNHKNHKVTSNSLKIEFLKDCLIKD